MGLKRAERVTATRSASPACARPEDIFLAWLFWLPKNADLLEAARREIQRIDCRAIDADGPRQLKALFVALIENRRGQGALSPVVVTQLEQKPSVEYERRHYRYADCEC